MPQGTNSQKGTNKGRAPAHQNTFAFKHNPKSKLTEKILTSPIEHVCQRCFEKIEWRKKYRKYKPRSQPGKCNLCEKRNIMAAYHTICTACTTTDRARKAILVKVDLPNSNEPDKDTNETVPQEALDDAHTELDGTGDVVEQLSALQVISDTTPAPKSISTHTAEEPKLCHRVCAICAKEPALPDEDEGAETVDDMLSRENRRIKLRERRALERHFIRNQEDAKQSAKDAKQSAKEARRRARKGDNEDKVQQDDESSEDSSDADPSVHGDDDDDDDEDPFLKAVGGVDKLLTGAAYQKMLLERELKSTEKP